MFHRSEASYHVAIEPLSTTSSYIYQFSRREIVLLQRSGHVCEFVHFQLNVWQMLVGLSNSQSDCFQPVHRQIKPMENREDQEDQDSLVLF